MVMDMLANALQIFWTIKKRGLMKTISVIIPTYNTSKEYFSKCLESLACKQVEEIEVIVIDDGSLEQYSYEIKQEIEKSPFDIDYYRKKNGGQNSAREYGLAKATAQYVFFMDADDYVDTAALDDVIFLLKNNHPDILAFNYDVRTPDGGILEKHERWKKKYDKVDVHKGLFFSNSLWLQIYKKDVLCKSGIHLIQGVRIGEDMASATAILATIGIEYATGVCFYHYVKHPGSALSNPPKESALDMVRAFDAMLEQLDTSIQEKYHTELEWLAILHVLYYNTERILESYGGNKQLVKETRDWLDKKYPTWKKNPYLGTELIAKSVPFIMIESGHVLLLQNLRKMKRRIKYLLKRPISKVANKIRRLTINDE